MQRLASPVDRSHTSWEVLLDRPSFFASFFESYTLAVSNGTPWDRRDLDEATVSPQHDARWFTRKEKTVL